MNESINQSQIINERFVPPQKFSSTPARFIRSSRNLVLVVQVARSGHCTCRPPCDFLAIHEFLIPSLSNLEHNKNLSQTSFLVLLSLALLTLNNFTLFQQTKSVSVLSFNSLVEITSALPFAHCIRRIAFNSCLGMIASKSGMPVTRLLSNVINKRQLGSVASTTWRMPAAKHSHEYIILSYPRRHNLSTVASGDYTNINIDHQPMGALFESKKGGVNLLQDLVGKTASIGRVFGSRANAQGLLTCGGEELARHASFDPDYSRARGWIQNRAIGPAVLSPVLISGLVGALVEAALPQAVPVRCSMHQVRPLIVSQ
jgi:hypothetical protein